MYFVWMHQKYRLCFIRHTAELLYRVVLYGYYQLSHDHISGTAHSVLIACVQSTERRAVASTVLPKQGKDAWSSLLRVFTGIVSSPPA